ncbi:MAG: hypothetical protein JW955_24750 [Sedimentisphaerales bacterium]|nr:hypothetical protein [Sedimentisphaerales bacterium]
MPSRSLLENGTAPRGSVDWCTLDADWPLERIEAEVEVTAPREPNILEWAVMAISEVFEDQPASLEEASVQLGLEDPVLLKEALQALENVGAIERREAAEEADLRHVRLTAAGRQLLREGRIPGVIERHGLHLHFDSLTGEHLVRQPRKTRHSPDQAIVDPDDLPPRLQNIGLDRIRELSICQGEPFHQGESRIVGVSVHLDQGCHLWTPVAISLSIDPEGVLHATLRDGESRQTWFNEHGWGLGRLQSLGAATTGRWANGRCRVRMPSIAASGWLDNIDRAVAPQVTVSEATRLVDDARDEVVVHAGWLDAPGFEAALIRSTGRGVRCFICSAEPGLRQWSAANGRPPGFMASGGGGTEPRPLAIVVDRARGMSVDHVCVRTVSAQEITIEAASCIKAAALVGLRAKLLTGVVEDLRTQDSQRLFAAFCLTSDAIYWEQAADTAENQFSGSERLVQLRRLGEWAGQIAHDNAPPGGWLSRAERAWWAILNIAIQGIDGEYVPLLEVAPRTILSSEVLSRLVERITPASLEENTDEFCELIIRAGDVHRRWPDGEPVTRCPAFMHRIRACFAGEQVEYRPLIQRVVRTIERHPRFEENGATWLQVLSRAIPAPHDLLSLAAWLDSHASLRAHLGRDFEAAARQQLYRLGNQLHAQSSLDNGVLRELRGIWKELGLPDKDLARVQGSDTKSVPARQANNSHTNQRRKQ